MKKENDKAEEQALILTNEMGKYHDKVVAMIQNAEEGIIHPIISIRLMQNMSKQYIDKLTEDADDKQKEIIKDCLCMVDDAEKKGVYKITNNNTHINQKEVTK